MNSSIPYSNSQNALVLLTSVALAAILLPFGCGGDAPSETESSAEPADAARVDLCPLLTASDIEEVFGQSVGEPEPGNDGLGQCTWRSPDGSEVVKLTLERAVLDSFDDFVRDYGVEFGGENPPRDRYHPVEGVGGDWAMYSADEHMVEAYRGDEVLEVVAPSAEEAQLVDLAARAMARLP